MSLGQLVGELALAGQMMFAAPDTAAVEQKTIEILSDTTKTEQTAQPQVQDNSKIANPFHVTLETGVSDNFDNEGVKPVNFERIIINNSKLEIKYDWKINAPDVLKVGYNLMPSMQIAAYMIGDMTGKDFFWWEVWKDFKLNDKLSLLVDIGTGAGKGAFPGYYAFVKTKGEIKGKKFFVGASYFNDASNLDDIAASSYIAGGIDLGKTYLGLGRNKNGNLVGVTCLKGLEDFGAMGFGIYNPETKNWNFKAQAGLNDVDKQFFSQQMMDYVVSIFGLPIFYFPHLGPQESKGIYTFKLEGDGAPGWMTFEAKAGFRNKIIPFAAGVSTLTEEAGFNGNTEKKTDISAVLELYKPFKFDNGVSGYAEAKYNMRTNTLTGYLVFKYDQK